MLEVLRLTEPTNKSTPSFVGRRRRRRPWVMEGNLYPVSSFVTYDFDAFRLGSHHHGRSMDVIITAAAVMWCLMVVSDELISGR